MAVRRPNAANGAPRLSDRKIRTAIVVPAHNEEATIEATLAAVAAQLSAQDRVLVVADNCADGTADIASRCGAVVLRRDDKARPGKGYAMDFAIGYLSEDPPDVVMFLDADCHLSNGALSLLAELAFARRKPVQARYEVVEPAAARDRQSIARFAWLVRGKVRPIGLAAMGLPCQLYGTGMVFPWSALPGLSLASSNIVEDMKLTLELIGRRALPMFCNDAAVISPLPSTDAARSAQRKRWEHGHIAIIFRHGIPALAKGIKARDMGQAMLALDVCVPPLGLLFLLLILGTLGSALAVPFAEVARYTTLLLFAGLLGLSAGLLLAWNSFGRDVITAKAIWDVPAYLAAKLVLYLKFITDRQKQWNRTDRR